MHLAASRVQLRSLPNGRGTVRRHRVRLATVHLKPEAASDTEAWPTDRNRCAGPRHRARRSPRALRSGLRGIRIWVHGPATDQPPRPGARRRSRKSRRVLRQLRLLRRFVVQCLDLSHQSHLSQCCSAKNRGNDRRLSRLSQLSQRLISASRNRADGTLRHPMQPEKSGSRRQLGQPTMFHQDADGLLRRGLGAQRRRTESQHVADLDRVGCSTP